MEETFALAVAAHRAGDFEMARRGYEAALPKLNAARNLAALYVHFERHAEAERIARLILAQRPDDTDARYTLAFALLATGRYVEGWRAYEARRANRNTAAPATDAPEWLGDDPAGRRIVVCGEQGFGDQIQFSRYVWELQRRGADVTFAVHPALVRLFAYAGLNLCPYSPASRVIPDCDAWVFEGSLPSRLGIGEPLPPVRLGPTLHNGQGVGVVPTGSPTPNPLRSLPSTDADRLLALGCDLRPEATGARDFLATAEIIAGLELVITVDTATAHLAGAMGIPTWVLLPAFDCDWRWQAAPWYPRVRFFRQPAPGQWAAILAAIERELVRSKPPSHRGSSAGC